MKRFLIVTFFIATYLATAGATCLAAENPNEMEARSWMQLDRDARAVFVVGYLAGINDVLNIFGAETRTVGDRPVTYEELSKQVYKHLLDNPELRSGPIGAIILNALNSYITITDRSGNPIQVDDNE